MGERCAAAYRGVRERVTGLVTALDPARDAVLAPATPAWTVHDLLAHLVGVARDAVDGRMDGVATDPWTDAQVQRRRDASRAALLAEWDEYGPRFEQQLARIPDERGAQAVFDAVTHEHDLRHAIGVPGARTSDAVAVAFDWLCAARGGAPLRFVTDAGERTAGTGTPVTTLVASRFEILRASTGRRTRAEVAGYDGEGSCDPSSLLAAPFFTVRGDSLHEQQAADAPRTD